MCVLHSYMLGAQECQKIVQMVVNYHVVGTEPKSSLEQPVLLTSKTALQVFCFLVSP